MKKEMMMDLCVGALLAVSLFTGKGLYEKVNEADNRNDLSILKETYSIAQETEKTDAEAEKELKIEAVSDLLVKDEMNNMDVIELSFTDNG